MAAVIETNALSEQQVFISTEYGTVNANFGFIESELESSPLNRVFKQRAAGNTFNPHPMETQYLANEAQEVRDFQAINGWYAAEDLFKIIQTDENENSIIIYTDKIGRKIMQDQEGSKTYFLYNDLGLLEQVIQPEAAEKGHNSPMLTYLDQSN